MQALTIVDNVGEVRSGDLVLKFLDHPKFSFDYIALYYEEEPGNYFYHTENSRERLMPEQRDECINFISTFLRDADYLVNAYDTETLIYQGPQYKSKAQELGLSYTTISAPEFPMARFAKDKWEQIYAAVRESGAYVIRPAKDDPSFVMYATKEEWDNGIKPEYMGDIWDFKSKTWVRPKSLAATKEEAERWIRSLHDTEFKHLVGGKTAQEMYYWSQQMTEARDYFEMDESAYTPFIDGMLESLPSMTKEELAAKIIGHGTTDKLREVGQLHGKRYAALQAIKAAESYEELDAFMYKFTEDKQAKLSEGLVGKWRPKFYE